VNSSSKDPAPDIEIAASRWVGRHDAGMTVSDRAEFERWKAADPRHERAYARHEQTWKDFDRPMAAGKAKVMIEALAASKHKRQRRKVKRLVTGLSTCVLVGLLWYQNARDIRQDTSSAFIASNAKVTLPERRTLPDGSIVELKSGAVIGVNFGTNARQVTLKRGEAFFQVVKNPLPFVVSADGVGVRAVGTAFSVQLGAHAVDVLVTEGTVAVESSHVTRDTGQDFSGSAPGGETGHGQVETEHAEKKTARGTNTSTVARSGPPSFTQSLAPVLVGAGTRVLIDRGSQTLVPTVIAPLAPADMAERLAWRKTRLEFTDTPLAIAIDLFNRHSPGGESYRLMIDPEDLALARMEVSGYFSADNVDAFVHLIEQTLEIKAERQTGRIILRRAR